MAARLSRRPRVVLIRHAESEFNRAEEAHLDAHPELRDDPDRWDTDDVFDPHTFDAELSATGRRQCLDLCATVAGGHTAPDAAGADAVVAALRDTRLVLCSPYTRAIQTAGLVFGTQGDGGRPGGGSGVALRLVPELGEHVASSCDIGRVGAVVAADPAVDTAIAAFPSLPKQLEILDDGWWGQQRPEHFPPGLHLSMRDREPVGAFAKRCAAAARVVEAEVAALDGSGGTVAVVAHSVVFHELTGEWLDNCRPTEVALTRAANGEVSVRIVGTHSADD